MLQHALWVETQFIPREECRAAKGETIWTENETPLGSGSNTRCYGDVEGCQGLGYKYKNGNINAEFQFMDNRRIKEIKSETDNSGRTYYITKFFSIDQAN